MIMVHSDRKIKGSASCTIICAYFILKAFLCENAICILPLVYISSKTHRVGIQQFFGGIFVLIILYQYMVLEEVDAMVCVEIQTRY